MRKEKGPGLDQKMIKADNDIFAHIELIENFPSLKVPEKLGKVKMQGVEGGDWVGHCITGWVGRSVQIATPLISTAFEWPNMS